MRMRLKKYLNERVDAAKGKILIGYDQDKDARNDAPLETLDFAKVFGNDNPVCLEVGCGKGQWVCRMAAAHPDVAWVDFNERLVDSTGWVPPAMMADQIHPTDAGYDIWLEALLPHLRGD